MKHPLLKLLIAFAVLFSGASSYAQSGNDPLSDPSPFSYFYRFGEKTDLHRILPHVITRNNQRITNSVCNGGYFELTFINDGTGTGFYDNNLGQARKNVICQVFTDLSKLILPKGSPTVRIEVYGIDTNTAFAANAGAFTSYLPGQDEGFYDGAIWKAINTGIDPWLGTAAAGGFHGQVNINFHYNFYLDYTSPVALSKTLINQRIDLYSVVLHEVIHALGFGSFIQDNGGQNYGSFIGTAPLGIYSRFDYFLSTQTGQKIIQNGDNCYATGIDPATKSSLTTACSGANTKDLLFKGPSTMNLNPPIVIKAGTFSKGTTLSHLDDVCNTPSGDMMMGPGIPAGPGSILRQPDDRVVRMLCDMGYRISNTYSDLSQRQYRTNYTACNRNQVIGANDNLAPAVAGGGTKVITFSALTGNDLNTNKISCLTVGVGGTVSGSTLLPGGSVTFTADANFAGKAVLTYIPVNTSDPSAQGNITYVFIDVTQGSLPSCTPDACNLVCNGDFEGITYGNLGNLDDFKIGYQNTPDILTGSQTSQGACFGDPLSIPVSPHGGNSFVRVFSKENTANASQEGVVFRLKSPMLKGHSYSVEFWATTFDSNLQQDGYVAMAGSLDPPCPYNTGTTNPPPAVTPYGTTTYTPYIVLKQPVKGDNWNFYSITYVPSNDIRYLLVYTGYDTQQCGAYYSYLDDIVVHETGGLTVTANPPAVCLGGHTLLSVNNADSTCQYTWTADNSLSSASGRKVLASPTLQTTYTVTSLCGGACSKVASVVVGITNVAPTVNISIQNDTDICPGSYRVLTANVSNPSSPSYLWSNGPKTKNDTIDQVGTYGVTVTNNTGCSAISSITVNDVLPVVSIQATYNSICPGTPDTLWAYPQGLQYNWSNGASTPFIVVTQGGNYSVQVVKKGCLKKASITIGEYPGVTANAGPDKTIACGRSVSIGGNPTGSGGSGVTYSWSPSTGLSSTSNSNPTANPTETATYMVTVTNSTGCMAIDAVIVNVSHIILNASVTPTLVDCAGNVSLSASGNGCTYHWTGTDGSDYNARVINTIALTSTTYTVTSACTGQCPAKAEVILKVNPIVLTAVTDRSTYCLDGDYAFLNASVQPFSTSLNYQYTWSDGTQVYTGEEIKPTLTGNPTYTVTVSASNGCTATNAVYIFNDCNCRQCNNTLPLVSGLYLSSSPAPGGIYCGDFFFVQPPSGQLTATITIKASELKMSDAIIVKRGATLVLDSCHLYPCAASWGGIEVEDGGHLQIINNSLIEDTHAPVIIKASHETSNILTLRNSTFNRFEQSISIEPYTFGNVPIDIAGCILTSRDIPSHHNSGKWPTVQEIGAQQSTSSSLTSPYISDSKFPSNNIRAYFEFDTTGKVFSRFKPNEGLYLDQMGLTVNIASANPTFYEIRIGDTGNPNIFDNMKWGIFANRSNITCVNSIFQNCTFGGLDSRDFNPQSGGRTTTAMRLRIMKSSPSASGYSNQFYNCINPINALNQVDLQVTDCYVSCPNFDPIYLASNFGVNYVSSQPKRVLVKGNTFKNVQTGVFFTAENGYVSPEVLNGSSATQYLGPVNISSNTFLKSPEGSIEQGIYVSSTSPANVAVQPGAELKIDSNQVEGYSGLSLTNWSSTRSLIEENTVTLSDFPNHNQYGIYVANSRGGTFTNLNRITGNNVENSEYAYLPVFPDPGLTHAIYISSSSNQQVSCNTVGSNYTGIEFAGLGKNIKWVYNAMENTLHYGFVLSNNGIIGQQGYALNAAENQWTGLWRGRTGTSTGNFKTATFGGSSSQNSIMYVGVDKNPSGQGYSDGSAGLPANTRFNTANGSVKITLAAVTLPPFCAGSIIIGNDVIRPPQISVLTTLEKIVQDLLPLSLNISETRFIYKSQIYESIANNTLPVDNSQVLQQFANDAASQCIGILYQIKQALSNGNYTQAQSLNNSLDLLHPTEAAYKAYNELYIKLHTTAAPLSPGEKNALFALANGCPFTDGMVVYEARALYNATYKTLQHFTDNCVQNANQGRIGDTPSEDTPTISTTGVFDVVLYPNPNTDGQVQVAFTSDAETQLEVMISDVMGRTVYTGELNVQGGSANLSLHLSEGVYSVKFINTSTNETIVKKLIVKK